MEEEAGCRNSVDHEYDHAQNVHDDEVHIQTVLLGSGMDDGMAPMVQIHSKKALVLDHVEYGNNDHENVQDVTQTPYNQATSGSRGSLERIYHNYTYWQEAYDSLGILRC